MLEGTTRKDMTKMGVKYKRKTTNKIIEDDKVCSGKVFVTTFYSCSFY
jgi:hypothetical protein